MVWSHEPRRGPLVWSHGLGDTCWEVFIDRFCICEFIVFIEDHDWLEASLGARPPGGEKQGLEWRESSCFFSRSPHML